MPPTEIKLHSNFQVCVIRRLQAEGEGVCPPLLIPMVTRLGEVGGQPLPSAAAPPALAPEGVSPDLIRLPSPRWRSLGLGS